MPTANHQNYPNCTNCGTPMWPGESYCPDCSQKKYTGPPGFWELITAFFHAVFDLDNRFFTTLRDILVPGRLTNYFLAGKQRSYLHPLRIFFVSGVLMVGAYTITATDAIGDSMERDLESSRAEAYAKVYEQRLAEALDSLHLAYPDTAFLTVTDSLQRMMATNLGDSIGQGYLDYRGGLTLRPTTIRISAQDFRLRTPQEILDKYEVEGKINRYQLTQFIRLNRLTGPEVATLIGQSIWALLFLAPLTALLLKLLYIRRSRRYVEHFIFSVHVHAFVFLVQLLAAVELYLLGSTYLLVLSIVITGVYLLLAMKRVYRQGWVKTVLKAAVLIGGYLFIFTVAVSFAALLAALLF